MIEDNELNDIIKDIISKSNKIDIEYSFTFDISREDNMLDNIYMNDGSKVIEDNSRYKFKEFISLHLIITGMRKFIRNEFSIDRVLDEYHHIDHKDFYNQIVNLELITRINKYCHGGYMYLKNLYFKDEDLYVKIKDMNKINIKELINAIGESKFSYNDYIKSTKTNSKYSGYIVNVDTFQLPITEEDDTKFTYKITVDKLFNRVFKK